LVIAEQFGTLESLYPGRIDLGLGRAPSTQVTIWILGSSLFGAQLPAELGLPYAFASHFAPGDLTRALEIYRSGFKPSARWS